MKRNISSILIALLTLPMFAQQQAQAKTVLDKMAITFEKAGGVQADFAVQAFNKGRLVGESAGTIQLKGDKFLLKTPEVTTWFDGKTQWSYLVQSEEVNITTPTPEELQTLNPYALLALYKKGFSYALGPVKVLRGKPVYEVILTATNKRQELSRLTLYVTKEECRPVCIVVESRNGNKSEVVVTGYQAGEKYPDAMFVFNKSKYPRAEIIDLR